MLHIPEGGLDAADLLIGFPALQSDFNLLDFFFWGHLKSLVSETQVAGVEDLTAKIVVSSADFASCLNFFERFRHTATEVSVVI
ncbi:hypothetical protein TNCV_3164871 [Trichonephila clavipes]|nr:hypothetical protein TNCV_3164871 [Trichonephila clavipes]